jgi:hypothetical protein
VLPDSITEITLEDTGFVGPMVKSIVFPKNLKTIPQNSAVGAKNLTTVKWPESLETIGTPHSERLGVFAGAGFTELVIPEGVKTIAYESFLECKNLTSVTIPESVETIEASAFAGCPLLTTVKMPSHPIKYPGQGTADYNMNVGAFSGNPKLTGIAVRKAITDTGYKANF